MKKKSKPRLDLVFHFIDPRVDVELDDQHDGETKEELLALVDELKQSIWIDKTYVGFEGSKYSDAFLTEDGWKRLCELVVESDFCTRLPPQGQEQLVEAYSIMITCYLYGELCKRGIDYDHIDINVSRDDDIEAEIYVDETPNDSWKDYSGTWQELEEEAEKASKKKKKAKPKKKEKA